MTEFSEDYYVNLIARMTAENEKLNQKIEILNAQLRTLEDAIRIIVQQIGR